MGGVQGRGCPFGVEGTVPAGGLGVRAPWARGRHNLGGTLGGVAGGSGPRPGESMRGPSS